MRRLTMSKTEIETTDGVKLVLEEKSVKTREEILLEMKRFTISLVVLDPDFKKSAELVVATLVELVHWMHDASGQHSAPSEMIARAITAETGQSSTDAAPAKLDVTPGAK